MNIPNGFKLVPVIPTDDMLYAASCVHGPCGFGEVKRRIGLEYRAALSVAPSPPQPNYDEANERELFEQAYRVEFEEGSGNELSDADIKSMRDGPWYGESRHYLNGQWAGWKQCAKHRATAGEVGNE